MQSIWDDFVAQRAVIKQMVSPTSAAERSLYMSWGETGYATQESALHGVAVPTHLLRDLVWRVCLASQSALAHSPQTVPCSRGSLQHRGLADATGPPRMGYWAPRIHWRCFFLCCSAGKVSSCLEGSLLVPPVLPWCVSLLALCVWIAVPPNTCALLSYVPSGTPAFCFPFPRKLRLMILHTFSHCFLSTPDRNVLCLLRESGQLRGDSSLAWTETWQLQEIPRASGLFARF